MQVGQRKQGVAPLGKDRMLMRSLPGAKVALRDGKVTVRNSKVTVRVAEPMQTLIEPHHGREG